MHREGDTHLLAVYKPLHIYIYAYIHPNMSKHTPRHPTHPACIVARAFGCQETHHANTAPGPHPHNTYIKLTTQSTKQKLREPPFLTF